MGTHLVENDRALLRAVLADVLGARVLLPAPAADALAAPPTLGVSERKERLLGILVSERGLRKPQRQPHPRIQPSDRKRTLE